jgi:hypothetical protein
MRPVKDGVALMLERAERGRWFLGRASRAHGARTGGQDSGTAGARNGPAGTAEWLWSHATREAESLTGRPRERRCRLRNGCDLDARAQFGHGELERSNGERRGPQTTNSERGVGRRRKRQAKSGGCETAMTYQANPAWFDGSSRAVQRLCVEREWRSRKNLH